MAAPRGTRVEQVGVCKEGLKFCLGAGASSNRVVAEAVLSVVLIWFQPREASRRCLKFVEVELEGSGT